MHIYIYNVPKFGRGVCVCVCLEVEEEAGEGVVPPEMEFKLCDVGVFGDVVTVAVVMGADERNVETGEGCTVDFGFEVTEAVKMKHPQSQQYYSKKFVCVHTRNSLGLFCVLQKNL